MANRADQGVVLPAGHTGSSLFHAVLTEAVARFPSALSSARLPQRPEQFKRSYGRALARFEAARINAPERVEIASFLLRRTQEELRFGNADHGAPLCDYLREQAEAPRLTSQQLPGRRPFTLELPFEGRSFRGREIHGVIDKLAAQQQLTHAARDGLRWIVDHATAQGGSLDLRGERFVLLGAGAELASTRMLLAAGADVLWVDLADPASVLVQPEQLSGRLSHAEQARDLLVQPREIAAAIRAFAEGGSVHVGLFAYAPGESKEWRLAAAMNAIVGSLPPELVRSLSLLISPTTASALTPDTVRANERRYLLTPGWQRVMARTGLFERPAYHRAGDTCVSHATVSLQGLSYQAAQYMSKIVAAETFAVFGSAFHDEPRAPVTVSANVAGVTRTRSLSHPLFNAAFLGAERFGVRIFDPATTRALSGMLMLHDLLNPAAPGAAGRLAPAREKASAVLSQQIHGGIYTLPFVLEGVIRAAAVVGLSSRPSILLDKGARVSEPQLAPLPAE